MNELPSRLTIIRKYTKLVSLCENNNANESASAAKAAADLREQHRITDAEIAAYHEANERPKTIEHVLPFDYDNMVLCDVLSNLPGVAVIVDQSSEDTLLVYIGPQASLARALHEKLKRVWLGLCRLYCFHAEEYVAVAAGLREAVRDCYAIRENTNTKALTLSYREAVQNNQTHTPEPESCSAPQSEPNLREGEQRAKRNKQREMYAQYRSLMAFGDTFGFSVREFSAGKHAAETVLA